MRLGNHPTLSGLLAVGVPFFRSEARGKAFAVLLVLILLLLGINGLNVVNNYVGRDFMTALVQKQAQRFYLFALAWAGVFAASTVVQVLAQYAQQRLALLWREWLTRHFLDRWLAGRTYLRLAQRHDIDNPDQRISQDVNTFTTTTLSFLVMLVNGVLTLATFCIVLWMITPWLFLIAVGYALFGSAGTILVGRRLVRLNNQQLQKEADFRYGLGRVREHAGAVAQAAGEKDEKTRLGGQLTSLVENFRSIITVSRNLGFFTTGYNFLPQIIPILVTAPLYVQDQIEFGKVTQSAGAFSQVLGAFSLVVLQFQALSAYAAVSKRLGALWQATDTAPAAAPEKVPAEKPSAPMVETKADEQRLAYDHLTLRTPAGRHLVDDLSLEVPPGKSVAVTGPCGTGKTALLLATAGLWSAGQGRVIRPGSGVMFLPHHPHPVAGSLRRVLLYGLEREVGDERLCEVLREVGLGYLLEGEGGLDAEHAWPDVLSQGEQQALGFARLLLACPRFAFLDNPVGLEVSRLEQFYRALARNSITYITVGAPPQVLEYHQLRLELQGDGKWRVEPTRTATSSPDD
jgi:putative ATP-binding cassette transporter